MQDIYIPTYVVNLAHRTDRKEHITKQFDGKEEFLVTIVEPSWHTVPNLSLWNSIKKIIALSIEEEHEVIIICEDDHRFTEHYSCEYLLKNIYLGNHLGMDYLLGGIGRFGDCLKVSPNQYLIDWFHCTQFVIVYQHFFQNILNSDFADTDVVDLKLAQMTEKKAVIHPFISHQQDFGYSDLACFVDNSTNRMESLFNHCSQRLFASTLKAG